MGVDSKKGGPDRGSRVASSQRIDDGGVAEEEKGGVEMSLICGFAVLGGPKTEGFLGRFDSVLLLLGEQCSVLKSADKF